jgi:pimeloyl-ACP methyl ester carboxylesterase
VTTPLLFIHGMYLNAESWEPWMVPARAAGFDPVAVSWPFHDGSPADLRATIDPGLGHLDFGTVVAALKNRIDAMPEPPVLIGHSVGGAAVQKLLDDGYGRAGVAISPAPPQGVLTTSPTFLRANFPHINPFAGNRPIEMTAQRFHFTFGNTGSRAASDAAFERYVVPESRNVPRSLLTRQAHIDFSRAERPPLHFLAGDSDHLVPLSLVRRNARRYAAEVGVTAFANRSHFLCNADGWEEVADAAFSWLRDR